MSQVKFTLKGVDTIIKCNKDDKMGNIFKNME